MARPARNAAKRKHTGLIVLTVIVGIILLIWIASEIAIPRIASSIIVNKIQDKFPQATDVSASVSAFPALKLAWKDYDHLEISGNDIPIEGVTFKSIVLESDSWPVGTVEAVMDEEEINRFFATNPNIPIDGLTIDVEGGKVQVSGSYDVDYLGTVDFGAVGELQVKNGREIYFVPESIEVADIELPDWATEIISAALSETYIYSLQENLPFTLSAIRAGNNELVAVGQVDLEKALNMKL